MRWVYAAPGRAAEWKRRVATVAAIDRWWAAFRDRSQALLGSLNPETLGFELVPFMREHLHAVHPELCWEFGPGVEGAQRRLTIAPEAKRHLLPVVETILEGAPDLPGWSFHSDRIREDPAHAVELVRQRYGLELAEFSFEVNAGDMGVLAVMVAGDLPGAGHDPRRARLLPVGGSPARGRAPQRGLLDRRAAGFPRRRRPRAHRAASA